MGVEIPVGFGLWSMPFRQTGDQDEMVITCGFVDTPAFTASAIAESLSNVFFALPSYAASSVGNLWTIGPGRVTVNRALGTFEGTGTVTRVGTNATLNTLPQNCAALIKKTTARGGRKGRGRMYVPPCNFAEGNVTPNGAFTSGIDASFSLDWNTLRTNWTALNNTPQLLHSRDQAGILVDPDAITLFTCDTVIATQRGRLRR